MSKWVTLMEELGREFAKKSAEHDEKDTFVAENYAKLRETGATAAMVPSELGGGGATIPELTEMIRTLARHCSSTALAFSMHVHPLTAQAYNWRLGNKAPEGLLKRIAAEKLVICTSGGSDWLQGSGKLTKVEGGFRFTSRKIFSSGAPAADLMLTMGIYDDPKDGPTVIHFGIPMKTEGVKVLDTWRTLGMRGTGSHDVQIENAFLPDAMMGGLRRPAGKWHPSIHTVALIALPIVTAAYLGAAESAREIALGFAKKKKDDPAVQILVGEMENHLVAAQVAYESVVSLAEKAKPSEATTNAVLTRRTLASREIMAALDKALDVAGGMSFYRSAGLERLFRDVQAFRYHPMQEKQQHRFTGRHLLGLDIDG